MQICLPNKAYQLIANFERPVWLAAAVCAGRNRDCAAPGADVIGKLCESTISAARRQGIDAPFASKGVAPQGRGLSFAHEGGAAQKGGGG